MPLSAPQAPTTPVQSSTAPLSPSQIQIAVSGLKGQTQSGPSAMDAPATPIGAPASDPNAPSVSDYFSGLANTYANAVPDFLNAAGSGNIQAGDKDPIIGDKVNQGEADVGNVLEGGLRSTASGLNTLIAPFTQGIIELYKAADQNPELVKFAQNFKPAVDAVNEWAAKNPNLAKNLQAGGVVGGAALGGVLEGASELNSPDTSGQSATQTGYKYNPQSPNIPKGLPQVDESGNPIKTTSQVNPDVQKVIDAVAPEEKGKTSVKSYENVVKGTRTADTTGILKTQALNTSDSDTALAQRLADIKGLGADGNTHLDNLKVLGQGLNDTEDKINEVVKNDTTTGTKDELSSKLDNLKTNKPAEYQGIREPNGKLYDKVVDYAKKVVGKNEESTEGFRNGRTAFDIQAKKEFPSAYTNGQIDETKPAGAAIKAVRDTWNRYTYDSSSRGDELEEHINREADIFRAARNIAPRAAAQDGSTVVDRYLDQHPLLDNTLRFAKRVATRAAAGGIISGIRGAL